MKIAVVDIGYVGLANGILLAQNHEVVALDIDQTRVDMVHHKKSQFVDIEIEEYLETKELNLRATIDPVEAFVDDKFIFISTPTNYDTDKKFFETSSVEETIEKV